MTVIHSAEFAREGGSLSGTIALADLPRLADLLASAKGEASWSLTGGVDRIERPFLRLKVQVEVQLVCQRCMKPLPFFVDADTVLTQFADEEKLDEAVEQDEDLEGILIEPELEVEVLIEDEILLALPYAPRHERCDPDVKVANESGKPNPFAVLAKLKAGKAED
jgi:uncharacterized protein